MGGGSLYAMAALQRVGSSLSTTANSYGQCKASDVGVSDQFPVGLRVLVVDDDTACLRILEHKLRRLLYQVTSCSQATVALNILRERKGCFDIVLSDVYMPDMDGYKLLEHVGLEMDLPVIMMSADGRTSAVMRGIKHGACDYLIKPIREEELKNIWQHVIRKKWNESKELEHCGSLEDNDRHKQGSDDGGYTSSVNEGTEGVLKGQKKRSSGKEEDNSELENDDPSAAKKPRVVWSVELHQQFVSAVNQCGIDKAVPKRILELMNVPGLTRENVASHLQKFRLYLKRLSGMAQQGGMSNAFCGPVDSNVKLSGHGRFDIQALAASGQIPPQTLAALHTELLGQSTGSLFTIMDQPAPLQASMQGSKCMPVEHSVSFGQPSVNCQSNISKHSQNMPSAGEVVSGFGVWPASSLGQVGSSTSLGGMDTQNCNILMDILQQQQQQHQLQKQQQQPQQSSLPETSHSITVQPSCLVVPSQSSASSRTGNGHASVNQNCSFTRGAVVDYSLLSPQSNSLLNIGHMSDGLIKTVNLVSGSSATGPVSPAASSSFVSVDSGATPQVQNPAMTFGAASQSLRTVPNICDIQGSYGAKSSEVLDQGLRKNLGFFGRGMCIPSRLVVDGCEPPMSNLNNGNINVLKNVNKVKEEQVGEFVDNARVGLPILPQFPPNNLMDVFTE